jgi:hypothetical protein
MVELVVIELTMVMQQLNKFLLQQFAQEQQVKE